MTPTTILSMAADVVPFTAQTSVRCANPLGLLPKIMLRVGSAKQEQSQLNRIEIYIPKIYARKEFNKD